MAALREPSCVRELVLLVDPSDQDARSLGASPAGSGQHSPIYTVRARTCQSAHAVDNHDGSRYMSRGRVELPTHSLKGCCSTS